MIYKTETDESIIIDCDCSCGNGLAFRIHNDDDTFFVMNTFCNNFYSAQNKTFWGVFKDRCKIIWCILRGKDYIMHEVVLCKDHFCEFRNFINDIDCSTEDDENDIWESRYVGEGAETLILEAARLAVKMGKISTSLLQRYLGIGYGKSLLLIDALVELKYIELEGEDQPYKIITDEARLQEDIANGLFNERNSNKG